MFDFTRRYGPMIGLSGLAGLLLALAGCGSTYPYVESFNRDLPEEADDGIPGSSRQHLTARQQAESVKAIKGVAAGHKVVHRPAPAALGVRWSEIPRAVKWAGGQAGVEMVITDTDETPDEYRFEMLTIEHWPAGLVIVRGQGDRVYEVESAWVGRFPEAPEHVARAALLVSHFEARLRVLGARKSGSDSCGPAGKRLAGAARRDDDAKAAAEWLGRFLCA